MVRLVRLGATLAALLLAACSAAPATNLAEYPSATPEAAAPPGTTGAGGAAVTIQGSTFSPAALTVRAGTTVSWTNRDPVPHRVTSEAAGGFDSQRLDSGQTFSFTFTQTGTFAYRCAFHPSMRATVVVTP